jgi:hypothetical protein
MNLTWGANSLLGWFYCYVSKEKKENVSSKPFYLAKFLLFFIPNVMCCVPLKMFHDNYISKS